MHAVTTSVLHLIRELGSSEYMLQVDLTGKLGKETMNEKFVLAKNLLTLRNLLNVICNLQLFPLDPQTNNKNSMYVYRTPGVSR